MPTLIDRSLPWLIYPGAVASSVLVFLSLLGAGLGSGPSAYLPVSMVAASVTLLELYHPYRLAWRPAASEVRADLAFMVTVQLLWPQLVTLLLLLAFVEPLQELNPSLAGIWPRDWPLGGQVVMLILASDFLRYWLHRAAHTFPLLWRLHAVHHAPERLYWLNVGRFHPVEKALQLLVETVPFALLGASETVIAFHFVLYKIHHAPPRNKKPPVHPQST